MDLADAVIDRARVVVPALCADGAAIARSTKCLLVPATMEGLPVVVKAVVKDAPVWSHYLRRERAVYEQLRPVGPVRVPRLVASGAGFLVLERVPGKPLARRRHDPTPIDAATWEALLAARAGLRAWGPIDAERPDRAVVTVMRRRLLEDPSAPVEWVVDGIRRLNAIARIAPDDAERMIGAIAHDPGTCFAHGDLLLRNVLRDDAGHLAVVDWECAGEHLAGWDAALLWVFAPAAVRRKLEDEQGASRRAFLACAAFALAREAFYRRRTAGDLVTERLRSEQARVLAELRST